MRRVRCKKEDRERILQQQARRWCPMNKNKFLLWAIIVLGIVIDRSHCGFLMETTMMQHNSCKHNYVSSSAQYDKDGDLAVRIPSEAQDGDLLLLFLSRTDGVLPLKMFGWTTGPSCLKGFNQQTQCLTTHDCLERGGGGGGEEDEKGGSSSLSSLFSSYCRRFPNGNKGQDLSTVLFYKKMERRTIFSSFEKEEISINLPGNDPGWAILLSIPGADTSDPIRDTAGVSCDRSSKSAFPSVFGSPGDILLLHMAFDDPAAPQNFNSPPTMTRLQHVHGPDEAGFLYGKRWDTDGNTPSYRSQGPGGENCKDALLSVMIRSAPGVNTTDSTLLSPPVGEDYCSTGS